MFARFAYHRKILFKLIRGSTSNYYLDNAYKSNFNVMTNLKALKSIELCIKYAIKHHFAGSSFKLQVLSCWTSIVKLIPKYKKVAKKRYLGKTMLPKPEPIHCPVCGIVVIKDSKTLSNYLLAKDLKCPECDTVVISVRQTLLVTHDTKSSN